MHRELLILRHGKSSWRTNHEDFDRPLKNRGKRESQRMGLWLQQQNLVPDCILSSPAERAIVTTEKLCKVMGMNPAGIQSDLRIYNAHGEQLMDLLHEVPVRARRVLLVGHNPGLVELLINLVDDEIPIPDDGKLLTTATLARLQLSCPWSEMAPGCAQLLTIIRGRSLPTQFNYPYPDSEELRDRPAYYYNQSSVIPYRLHAGKLEILIVSSSKKKHWVVPKGIKEQELTPQASAAQEALEEAGVEGEVGVRELGSYQYEKWGAVCEVLVYPMRVTRMIPRHQWEEVHRGRRWVSPDEAKQLLKQKALIPLIERLVDTVEAE